MYRSNGPRGSFSKSKSKYRGGGSAGRGGSGRSGSSNFAGSRFGGNRSGGGNFRRRSYGSSRRKQSTFDPSFLVKNSNGNQNQAQEKLAYVAKNKFSEFDIINSLKQNIFDRGYTELTPIQDQIIPLILEKKDVIGLASTGTGKTAAFLIPLIHHLCSQQSNKVLIMAPTRELAVQIEDEFRLFARGLNLYSSLCIGGASMNRQIMSLKRNQDFVIGTPGRLIDLEKRRILNFHSFSTIVLDEVDRMLDMGFVNDMKYVIEKLPAERHSLFFSATLPSKLNDIVNSFLSNPSRVEVEKQASSALINQEIVKVNGQSKVDLLHDLLSQKGFDKILVFGRTKHGLDKLARILFERGVKVAAIHGNKNQGQRQRALTQFKNNHVRVLLATDIASRGLDIDDVSHVINYDLPQTYEDYIHRIGRTGRANKTGVALSFVD